MSFQSRLSLSLLFLVALPALAQNPQPAQPDPEEQEVARLINEGANLARTGHAADALTQDIDPAVAKADAKIASEHRKIYAVRTQQESLLYLLQAANAKQDAVALPATWSMAYFFKGYLLNDLGRPAEARAFIQRALEMSPMNAQYLGEMGNLEIKDKNWDAALALFTKGEEASNAFSPDATKKADLGKMLRGEGYVYVEQHKLDQAEAAYRRALSVDPNDQRSAKELQFVISLKGQPTPPVAAIPPGGDPRAKAIFLFGRADFFHAAVAARNCAALDPAKVFAINQRFDAARARLAAKYGDAAVPSSQMNIKNEPCDPATLASYSNHVAEVEAALN